MPAEPVVVIHARIVLAIELLTAFRAIERRFVHEPRALRDAARLVQLDEPVPVALHSRPAKCPEGALAEMLDRGGCNVGQIGAATFDRRDLAGAPAADE